MEKRERCFSFILYRTPHETPGHHTRHSPVKFTEMKYNVLAYCHLLLLLLLLFLPPTSDIIEKNRTARLFGNSMKVFEELEGLDVSLGDLSKVRHRMDDQKCITSNSSVIHFYLSVSITKACAAVWILADDDDDGLNQITARENSKSLSAPRHLLKHSPPKYSHEVI
jgi:hypothetical protein